MITAQQAKLKTLEVQQQKNVEKKRLQRLKEQKETRLRNKYKKSKQFKIDIEFIKEAIDDAISSGSDSTFVTDGDKNKLIDGHTISLNKTSLDALGEFFNDLGYTTEFRVRGMYGFGSENNSIDISW